jgi:hypothetical protein
LRQHQFARAGRPSACQRGRSSSRRRRRSRGSPLARPRVRRSSVFALTVNGLQYFLRVKCSSSVNGLWPPTVPVGFEPREPSMSLENTSVQPAKKYWSCSEQRFEIRSKARPVAPIGFAAPDSQRTGCMARRWQHRLRCHLRRIGRARRTALFVNGASCERERYQSRRTACRCACQLLHDVLGLFTSVSGVPSGRAQHRGCCHTRARRS